ncbi:MAG: DsbE family thiol:disulfide interchange protein [Hyphomonadaceae bacterium]
MTRFWAFAPLIAFLLVAAAAFAVLTLSGERETVSREGLVGQAAPAYALTRLEGGEGALTPAAFEGRTYVVNLFASWCAPCRVEHRHLMALRAEGAPILGIAYKNRPASAAAFLAELGNPYEAVGLDPQGDYALQIGVTGVPETFVIGPDGRIRALHRGAINEQVIAEVIRPALAAP